MARKQSTPNWAITAHGCLVISLGAEITLVADEDHVREFLDEHYDPKTQNLIELDDSLIESLARLGVRPEEFVRVIDDIAGGDETDVPEQLIRRAR